MIGLEMCPTDSKKTDWERGRLVFAHAKAVFRPGKPRNTAAGRAGGGLVGFRDSMRKPHQSLVLAAPRTTAYADSATLATTKAAAQMQVAQSKLRAQEEKLQRIALRCCIDPADEKQACSQPAWEDCYPGTAC